VVLTGDALNVYPVDKSIENKSIEDSWRHKRDQRDIEKDWKR
jgi:hypothetical protein